jgi:hypothetical protein
MLADLYPQREFAIIFQSGKVSTRERNAFYTFQFSVLNQFLSQKNLLVKNGPLKSAGWCVGVRKNRSSSRPKRAGGQCAVAKSVIVWFLPEHHFCFRVISREDGAEPRQSR